MDTILIIHPFYNDLYLTTVTHKLCFSLFTILPNILTIRCLTMERQTFFCKGERKVRCYKSRYGCKLVLSASTVNSHLELFHFNSHQIKLSFYCKCVLREFREISFSYMDKMFDLCEKVEPV